MDLLKELKNYKEIGVNATLSGLKAEKRKIEEIQHVVSVLEVISQLSELVETPEWNNLNVKFIEFYPGQEEWGENKIEFVLLNDTGFSHDKRDEKITPTIIRINTIFDLIETGEDFMGDTTNTITIDFTPSSLKELQNYLLSPALQMGLEKAMLSQAVQPLAQTSIAPVLKI